MTVVMVCCAHSLGSVTSDPDCITVFADQIHCKALCLSSFLNIHRILLLYVLVMKPCPAYTIIHKRHTVAAGCHVGQARPVVCGLMLAATTSGIAGWIYDNGDTL